MMVTGIISCLGVAELSTTTRMKWEQGSDFLAQLHVNYENHRYFTLQESSRW